MARRQNAYSDLGGHENSQQVDCWPSFTFSPSCSFLPPKIYSILARLASILTQQDHTGGTFPCMCAHRPSSRLAASRKPWTSWQKGRYRESTEGCRGSFFTLCVSHISILDQSHLFFSLLHRITDHNATRAGGACSSTGLPPFVFSRITATPKSKNMSTRWSYETCSTGDAEWRHDHDLSGLATQGMC